MACLDGWENIREQGNGKKLGDSNALKVGQIMKGNGDISYFFVVHQKAEIGK